MTIVVGTGGAGDDWISRGLAGKVPDYVIKNLNKPSPVGSKIKGAVTLARILSKRPNTLYRATRYRIVTNKKRLIGAGVATGGIALLSQRSKYGHTPGSPYKTRGRFPTRSYSRYGKPVKSYFKCGCPRPC